MVGVSILPSFQNDNSYVGEKGLSLSSSEHAIAYEARLRLSISDIDPEGDPLVLISRLLNHHIPEHLAQSKPILRAMRDNVLVALASASDTDDLCAVAKCALDVFSSVHIIGARAKASAFFDKLVKDTEWTRIAIVAGSTVAEAAFLAVNHPKKSLTVIDVGPHFPGRSLVHRLASQTHAPVRYAPLSAAHKAVEQVDVIVIGANEIMMNGCVVVAPGGAAIVHAAHEAGVPVLVTAQAVKFSERALVDWFVDGDVIKPREIQAIVTELDTNSWRPTFVPDVHKKMAGERA